jgi:hypothetical protein
MIESDQSSEKFIFQSTMSWQMKVFLLLGTVFMIYSFFLSFSLNPEVYEKNSMGVWILRYLFPISFIFGIAAFPKILLSTQKIYIKRMIFSKIIPLDDITDIDIMSIYGRWYIPGVPGFIVTATNKSFWKTEQILFFGQEYAHVLTKLFINTAVAKNPSVNVSGSLRGSYGEPPYVIAPNILAKLHPQK